MKKGSKLKGENSSTNPRVRQHSSRHSFTVRLSSPPSATSFTKTPLARWLPTSYTSIRAIQLYQNTVVSITFGVVSVAIGIGIPVFFENQIDNAVERKNTQPCFPCNGSGAQRCRSSGDWKCNCRTWRG